MKEHPIDSGVESLLVIQATICHYIKKNLSEAKFGTRLKSWDGNMKFDNLRYNIIRWFAQPQGLSSKIYWLSKLNEGASYTI